MFVEGEISHDVHEEEANTDFSPYVPDDVLPIREVQRQYAHHALSACAGNLQATARALGVSVNTLKAWLADRPRGRKD